MGLPPTRALKRDEHRHKVVSASLGWLGRGDDLPFGSTGGARFGARGSTREEGGNDADVEGDMVLPFIESGVRGNDGTLILFGERQRRPFEFL